MSTIFFRKLCEVVNSVFIPFGDFAFKKTARKLPTNAAEIRTVFLTALESHTLVFLPVRFMTALTTAVIIKSTFFTAVAAAGYF